MTKQLSTSMAGRLTVQGLLAAAVIGLGITGIVTQLDRGNPVEAAHVQVKAEPVEPWVYDRTQNIRRELALTNLGLASMGLGKDETEAVLLDLKAWVEQNREQLEAKELVVMQARRELQLAQRSVRVGPRDEELIRSMPGLEKTLSEADEALAELHGHAGKAIERRLTEDQRSAWRTAQTNLAADVPSHYRYATNLSDIQRTRIKAAFSKRSSDLAKSKYADADQELSVSQKQALVAARSNQASNMEAVLRAEELALPVLKELRAEQRGD